MPDVLTIPGLAELVLVLLLIGVVAAGTTQLVKMIVKAHRKKLDGASAPSWWNVLFRVIPIILGGLSGTLFFDWPWGVFLGLSSGLLSTAIYAKARAIIKNLKVPVSSEDEDFEDL